EAPPPQARLDGERRALDHALAQRVAPPVAPEERVEVPGAEAVHRLDHLGLEREAPLLAVRDDGHAGGLLIGDRGVDGGVLDALERRPVELAAGHALPGLEQLRRAQHAADDVPPRHDHRRASADSAASAARSHSARSQASSVWSSRWRSPSAATRSRSPAVAGSASSASTARRSSSSAAMRASTFASSDTRPPPRPA